MATPVICLGEMLIDFVSTASGELRAATHFARAAGGAPANVAIGLARLGAKSAFFGTR
jgi:fructokinase